MIKKTHLAIGLVLGLLFLPHVSHKILFIPIILIASLVPDIDCAYSYLGHMKIFRPLQWFVRHRGLIHSFVFCVFICLICALFVPVIALPLFLGYFGHLFADSLCVEGILPFWPLKKTLSGKIRVGGSVEHGVFIGLVLVNIALFVSWFV